MPTYPYVCDKCDKPHEVIKRMTEASQTEMCPDCGVELRRVYTPAHFVGTAVQNAEYNPAFGKVIKNKSHREDEAKRRGMVEIGNDFSSPDKIHEHFDRAREEKLDRRYDEAIKKGI